MDRLRITEYFDSVINEIDLFTERKCQQDQRWEKFGNDRREEQIKVVKEMERKRLELANGGEKTEEESVRVKGGFCFGLEFSGLWFLVITNRQVSQEEKELFKVLIEWPGLSYIERLRALTKSNKDLNLSHSIDINLGFDLSSQFRSTSCAVVDVGEWFDREFNVEEIKFTSRGILRELEYKPIVSLLKVKKMRILLGHHTEKEKSQADVIYSIIKSLGKIDRVEAEIDFQTIHQMNEIYRQMRLNKDKDDQENKNITISINTSITTEKPFRTRAMRDYSCLIKHLNIAKIKRIKDMNGLSSLNWQSLAKLNISSMPFEPIMTADFTSLRSLKYLALSGLRRDSMLDDSHINWAFLDPVRDNLEELSFYSNEFQNISWKAFVGMHRLKCLIIREEKIDQIEIDSQGQLFADLQALKQLELSLTDIIMTTNWNLSLLALENLKPHPIAEITSCGISIQFNLPKLNSLTLSFSCYQFSNENISLLVEPFKDVQELYLYLPDLSCLKRGYFRDFKYLRKLWLETEENKDEVDQQVFDGLESLVELNIYTHLLQPGALSRLKNLEHIKIRSLRHDIANENYQQLFDGLESLKTFRIEKNYPEYSECQTSQSFVYFQNLDKVVFENIAF